jgi:hypothetical protein
LVDNFSLSHTPCTEIESHGQVINDIIDGALFIIKLEEHQFQLQPQDQVELRAIFLNCFNGVQLMFAKNYIKGIHVKFGRSLGNDLLHGENQRQEGKDDVDIDCLVLSNRLYLKTMCQFSFLALLMQKVNNNISLLREVFSHQGEQFESDFVTDPADHLMFRLFIEKSSQRVVNFGNSVQELHVIIRTTEGLNRAVAYANRTSCASNLSDMVGGISQNSTSPLDKADDEQFTSLFSCCCSIAHKLAVSAKCNWVICEGGVTFTAPCVSILNEEPFLGDTAPPPSEQTDDEATDKATQMSNEEQSVTVDKLPSPLSSLLSLRTFSILNDVRSESLFLEILQRIPGGRDIRFFQPREVFPFTVSLFKLAIVQNVEASIFLREKGFHGSIVLISERLAYVENERGKLFDFGCPIPCGERELSDLHEWLLMFEQAQDATSLFSDDMVQQYMFQSQRHDLFSVHPPSDKSIVLTSSWFTWFTDISLPFQVLLAGPALQPIPAFQIHSYLRWRYLNASLSPWHHSVLSELSLWLLILVLTIGVLLNFFKLKTYYFVVCDLFAIIMIKTIATRLVVPKSNMCSSDGYNKQGMHCNTCYFLNRNTILLMNRRMVAINLAPFSEIC